LQDCRSSFISCLPFTFQEYLTKYGYLKNGTDLLDASHLRDVIEALR
jgi:hypothetical protein